MKLQLVEYDQASPEVQKIYAETMDELNVPFVLNWFKCQGNNASLLRGNWEKLKSVLLNGSVPMVLKQLMIYNISKEKGCMYCAQAHGIMADSMSSLISDVSGFKVTQNINTAHLPSSYNAAINIVTKAALTPSNITDQDFDDLREEGFSDDELQELFSHADLVNMLNTIADISGIKLDNELMEVEA